MFQTSGPNPLFWTLFTLAGAIPLAIAVLYVIVLHMRDSRRKPRTARLAAIGIVVLVCSRLAYDVLFSLVVSMGWWNPAGSLLTPFLIKLLQAALETLGLVLLLRAAFLDETPGDYDPGPPVYRNDDGPEEDG